MHNKVCPDGARGANNGARHHSTTRTTDDATSLGAKAVRTPKDSPVDWLANSYEIRFTLATSDKEALKAVVAKFCQEGKPQLHVFDPHGNAIFNARKLALQTEAEHGQPVDVQAQAILQDDALTDDIAVQALVLLETYVLKKPPIPYARRVALHEAQVIYLLENPCFPLTDAGNGERLTFHCYGDALYCIERKKWLLWNGKIWELDVRNHIFTLAKQTARKIPDEAKAAKNEDYAAVLKWALKSESRERLTAMLFMAATEEGMTVSTDELDTDLWRFNVQNGTLDLRTGELEPHDRAHLQTKISPVHYDKSAKCPVFLAFLNKIFKDRQSIITFLQRVIGYSLTGDRREQIFLILYGGGSNGKSVLLEILSEIFGDYGHTMEAKTIYMKREDRMPSDIADLVGIRFAACSEGESGKRLGEAAIKNFTGGGDKLTGERKFEDAFTFTPQFQIFFATNHRLEIRGTDDAIWRRTYEIPFEVKFWNEDKGESGPPELKADKGLREKLRAELPGILAWAVQGCLDWQREGIGTPDEVINATNEYRQEQDRFSLFLSNSCVLGEGLKARANDLYADFTKWADENGEPKLSQRAFNTQLKERGLENKREPGTGRSLWFGISRRTTEQDENRCEA